MINCYVKFKYLKYIKKYLIKHFTKRITLLYIWTVLEMKLMQIKNNWNRISQEIEYRNIIEYLETRNINNAIY